eukprot:Clim_evm40s204 gene=Clim_evmTU40s204
MEAPQLPGVVNSDVEDTTALPGETCIRDDDGETSRKHLRYYNLGPDGMIQTASHEALRDGDLLEFDDACRANVEKQLSFHLLEQVELKQKHARAEEELDL